MRFTTALAVLAAAVAVTAPAVGAAPPVATASKSCSVGDTRGYGTTYVTVLKVSNTSCRAGKRLVRAFHACRPGKSGKCSRVSGYSCSESRFNKSSQSYDSRVTCTKGGKTVKHTYTQFT